MPTNRKTSVLVFLIPISVLRGTVYLQTPHFPPSFAQCLQYLQFLHALQGSAPVQVAEKASSGIWLRRMIDSNIRPTSKTGLVFIIGFISCELTMREIHQSLNKSGYAVKHNCLKCDIGWLGATMVQR